MYNSENNNDRSRYEYHYTYRPGGEPVPTLEPAAPQKPKTGMGKRIVAGGQQFVRDRFFRYSG